MSTTTIEFGTSPYDWHPLFYWVKLVKGMYLISLSSSRINGKLSKEQFEEELKSVDFKHWLDFIQSYAEENNLVEAYSRVLDVFKPLNITVFGPYALFKYKSFIELNDMGYDSSFFELYDGLYLECRSVVFDVEKEKIILAPQRKFKNVGEDEKDWSLKSILARINSPDTTKVEIMNKMDGSNQNFIFTDLCLANGWLFGSGSSALDRKESWRLDRGYMFLESNPNYKMMMRYHPFWTFGFEFCSPDNPVVVKYTKEQEGLYLFMARNNLTGKEMPLDELRKIAKEYNVMMADVYDNETLESIMAKTGDYTSAEKEGWVIRITDKNGDVFKAKLKCDDYVLMHKAITKLVSPNAIIQAMADGRWDDFFSKIPDAYKPKATEIATKVSRYVYEKRRALDFLYTKVSKEAWRKVGEANDALGPYEFVSEGVTRKIWMLTIQEIVPKAEQGKIIAMYLGKEDAKAPDVLRTSKGKQFSYIKLNEIEAFLEKCFSEQIGTSSK